MSTQEKCEDKLSTNSEATSALKENAEHIQLLYLQILEEIKKELSNKSLDQKKIERYKKLLKTKEFTIANSSEAKILADKILNSKI